MNFEDINNLYLTGTNEFTNEYFNENLIDLETFINNYENSYKLYLYYKTIIDKFVNDSKIYEYIYIEYDVEPYGFLSIQFDNVDNNIILVIGAEDDRLQLSFLLGDGTHGYLTLTSFENLDFLLNFL